MAAEALESVAGGEPEFVEPHAWPAVDAGRVRRFMLQQQGKDYVLYAGLLEALHQVSGGFFSIDTRLEQLPSGDNGQVAVVSALVRVYDPEAPGVVLRAATGIGDASPSNVNRLMAAATIRLAETRAKARALRDLCNVAAVALEELGPDGAEGPADWPTVERPADPSPPRAEGAGGPGGASEAVGRGGPRPFERIQIDGKAYTRLQVVVGYQKVRSEAQAAGLAIPPDQLLGEDASLSALAVAGQALRRRLEARNGQPSGTGK